VETILANFRSWLDQVVSAAPEIGGGAPAQAPPAVDLHTLLGQFIALRHEVNLQTRATRAQQEQNGETLRRLSQALESLEQTQEEARQTGPYTEEAALRPLLKTLVDVADALDLARRKMLQAQEGVWPLLERLKAPPVAPEPDGGPANSWWRKWFGGGRAMASAAIVPRQAQPGEEAAGQVRELLDSLIQGYSMSLQRVERALEQHGLERIECVGQPFDPERMEVMDAVAATGLPPGEVMDEVRRGYLWRGRVFRYALVRVAKS
jgi:molecular chaperone GrpE